MNVFPLRFWTLLSIACITTISLSVSDVDTGIDGTNDNPLKAANTSDFYDLVVNNDQVFVDKSLLIRELLTKNNNNPDSKVIFITQPEGYGKTLNMDMLRRFLDIEANEKGERLTPAHRVNRKLFVGGEVQTDSRGNSSKQLKPLKIANEKDAMRYQGRFPVIFISFENIKGSDFNEIADALKITANRLVSKYGYLKRYVEEEKCERNIFNFTGSYGIGRLERTLVSLSGLLFKHYKRKAFILIDEFDTPLVNSYLKFKNFTEFSLLRKFFWTLFVGTFKISKFCKKAFVTGILPYRSSNLGVNNSTDYTLLDKKWAEYYGFNGEELDRLLENMTTSLKTPISSEEMKAWHLGYDFHGEKIYNPRSVMTRLRDEKKFDYYHYGQIGDGNGKWFIEKSFLSDEIQEDLQRLVAGENISIRLPKEFPLDLDDKIELLHNVLIFSGYLIPTTAIDKTSDNREFFYSCNVSLPNERVKLVCESAILRWVCDKFYVNTSVYRSFVKLLSICKIPEFKDTLEALLSSNWSNFNRMEDKKLKIFYKSFALSLRYALASTYRIADKNYTGEPEQNMILLSKSNEKAIIVMYKLVENLADLEFSSKTGLEEIYHNLYANKKKQYVCVEKVVQISMAFCKAKVALEYRVDHI